MEMRFLNNLPAQERLGVLTLGLERLKADYALNLRDKLFEQIFGRVLTFEEFIMMMLVEKDFVIRAWHMEG